VYDSACCQQLHAIFPESRKLARFSLKLHAANLSSASTPRVLSTTTCVSC